MNVHKCDFCKKEVDRPITAGVGFFTRERVELCDDCGTPILKFLQEHKIIKEKQQKICSTKKT